MRASVPRIWQHLPDTCLPKNSWLDQKLLYASEDDRDPLRFGYSDPADDVSAARSKLGILHPGPRGGQRLIGGGKSQSPDGSCLPRRYELLEQDFRKKNESFDACRTSLAHTYDDGREIASPYSKRDVEGGPAIAGAAPVLGRE